MPPLVSQHKQKRYHPATDTPPRGYPVLAIIGHQSREGKKRRRFSMRGSIRGFDGCTSDTQPGWLQLRVRAKPWHFGGKLSRASLEGWSIPVRAARKDKLNL